LTASKVRSMLILALIFVMLVNCFNGFRGGVSSEIHYWKTPIMFSATLMAKTITTYSNILLSFCSCNGATRAPSQKLNSAFPRRCCSSTTICSHRSCRHRSRSASISIVPLHVIRSIVAVFCWTHGHFHHQRNVDQI